MSPITLTERERRWLMSVPRVHELRRENPFLYARLLWEGTLIKDEPRGCPKMVLNTLRRAGFMTWEQVGAASEAELCEVNGLGEKGRDFVRAAFA